MWRRETSVKLATVGLYSLGPGPKPWGRHVPPELLQYLDLFENKSKYFKKNIISVFQFSVESPRMPKSGKKKKGKTKKLPGNATPEAVVKRLLKTYDRNCLLTQSHVCCGLLNSLKDCVENNTLLSNVSCE